MATSAIARVSMRWSLHLLAALLLAALGGCSVSGKLQTVGEPPIWDDELPAPEESVAAVNTLRIVLQCPLMEEDEEFVAQLEQAIVSQCRKAGMGDVQLLPRGSIKKAHYEVVVYQAGEAVTSSLTRKQASSAVSELAL